MGFFEKIGTDINELKDIEYKIEMLIESGKVDFKEIKKINEELEIIRAIISHGKFYGEI